MLHRLIAITLILVAGAFIEVLADDHIKALNKTVTLMRGNETVEGKVILETDKEWWIEMGDSVLVMPRPKENFFKKVINYILEDKDHSNDRFWFSIIGGPHYDTDTKLGLAVMGNVFYRLSGSAAGSQPSNLTARVDVSTSGYVSTKLKGNTLIYGDKRRLNYEFEFESLPSYYWGMGFDDCDINENKTRMKRKQAYFNGEFLWRIGGRAYIGPAVNWTWVSAEEILRPDLLNGQPLSTRSYGVGMTIDWDSRDLITSPESGVYAHAGVLFYPKGLWNDYAFTRIDTRFCYYKRVWKGGVMAGELKGQFNLGDPSWNMMAQPGDSYTLRGYFRGRYRDKHAITAQLELRQHVWNRLGVAVWGGLGSLFHDSASMKHLLPNGGVGLRWSFRPRVNIRLDYGFGRSGESGFIFSMHEAF